MLYRLRAESHRLAVEKVEQEVKCARTEEEARRAAELLERKALAAAEEERRKLERAQFDPGQTRPQPKKDETTEPAKVPTESLEVRGPSSPGIAPAEDEPMLTRYFHLLARNPVAAVLVVVFYFLPFLIGLCRKHRNAVPIFIIDLLLGWTLLAWIGCLAWAFTANTRESAAHVQQTPADLSMILGIVGSLVLVLGVFSPLISHPIMGTINYFHNGKGDGVIVLVLAGISLLLSLSRIYGGLWFTGLLSGGCLAFTFIRFWTALDEMKSENPLLATGGIQMQWGWAILTAGVLMVLAAATLKLPTRR
jgi:hypothetical protein